MLVEISSLALQTDKGIVLATRIVDQLRAKNITLPSIDNIERICAEAITTANRQIYSILASSLSSEQEKALDQLLDVPDDSSETLLTWLRKSPRKPNSRYMLEHIERLKVWKNLNLPDGIERQIHQNRLLKIAREGSQMTATDLAKFEEQRKYATLVAVAIESTATVTDEIIDLHDRILGRLFNAAKKSTSNSFNRQGNLSMTKYVYMSVLVMRYLMPKKKERMHSKPLNLLCLGKALKPVLMKQKSWRNRRSLIFFIYWEINTQHCGDTLLLSYQYLSCVQPLLLKRY